MWDKHLTTPLKRPPRTQYLVGQLERSDLPDLMPELQSVVYDNPDQEQLYPGGAEAFLRIGGRIAIAYTKEPSEQEDQADVKKIHAVAALSPRALAPKVFARDDKTPDEVVDYLEGYARKIRDHNYKPTPRQSRIARMGSEKRRRQVRGDRTF
jgi:hypothetical protein